MLIICSFRAILHAVSVTRGFACTSHSETPPTVGFGSSSSPSSPSSNQQEFRDLISQVIESGHLYSYATCKVGML